MTPPTHWQISGKKDDSSMYRNTDNDRFHSRKNPRIRDFDYSTPNYYFVTICTHEKRCIFGTPETLNAFGNIAKSGLLEIENHFSGVGVDKYVVMPNHVHAIIVLQNSSANLSTIIGQYKAFVTKQIHTVSPTKTVWQTSYHDHIIRSQKSYERIWYYIETNPIKWREDCFYCSTAASK